MPLTIFFPDAGTFTIDDDGIRGNNTSVIRDGTGAIIFTFTHPSDSILFSTLTSGVNFIFNTADTFGNANINVGNVLNPNVSPTSISVNHLRTEGGNITLAATGSIAELGDDASSDIVANAVTISASTGIGTAANAIETQVNYIEAQTGTGGMNIANINSVIIGGLTPDLPGLRVITSGDINLSATGYIWFNEGGSEAVRGGPSNSNVTLTAIGYEADIFTFTNGKWISAPGGGITLNAGRDILVGTAGANFDNDLLATNFVTINAGRDFVLDGLSNVRTGAFGGVVGGDVLIQAGRNITLANATGGTQTIEAFQGNITLRTGPNGAFIQNAIFAAAIQTTHDIFLIADAVLINSGGLNTTGIGQISIRPATPGRAINLGSTADLIAALSLSDAEFDRLYTLNVSIGDDNSGPVTFSAPLTPYIVDNLTVRSAAEILIESSVTLPRALTLRGDNVFQLAASTLALESLGVFVDRSQNDGGLGGLAAFSGAVTASAGSTFNGNGDGDTMSGTAGADTLLGFAGNDTLRGLGGADTLDGGTGADAMFGGLGNDTYIVDNVGDQVNESAGEGNDTVFATASYALTAGSEIESLGVLSPAATTAIDLTGNSFANRIVGNAGSNTLNGGGGADDLYGEGGNDFYVVDNVGDRVFEAAGNGYDIVFATTSYALLAGQQVESLGTFNPAATTALMLIGNELANRIVGNAGANYINGAAGADELYGDAGADEFGFTTALGGGNVDLLGDFNSAADTIDLGSAIFSLPVGALNPNAFRLGSVAGDADDRIIYNSSGGFLIYDADGNGPGGAVLFATVAPGTVINASDFLVI